ncbi:MAG: DUF4153 domain-containing protein [Mediterranea sp.]|jgi:hypothetical protein|nr:DUF4153 domain-containing protein [Mediterranea sp.]
MKKLPLRTLYNRTIVVLLAHPVEIALGIFFFIIYLMSRSKGGNSPEFNMQLFFPLLFAVAYCCNYFFKEKARFVYYLTFFLVVPLYLLRFYLEDFTNSSGYPFTMLLVVFLMLGHRKAADNTVFARQSVKMLIHCLFAFLIGFLLLGAVAAIYASACYIFDWKGWTYFYGYGLMLILYLFVPLLFCYLQDKESEGWEVLPKAVQVVLNFILSPAIIVYTVILYVYAFTILIRWELPKGGVAAMVMAFIIAAFSGHMSQLIVSRRYYNWFYRAFTLIAIPPLVLFWEGTMHRIMQYSFTEARVYLLAASVLMTLFVFFLASKRWGNYRLMLLISSIVIVLLTYIPGISARSIGIAAQEHRMVQLARSLSLWDEQTSKLKEVPTIKTSDLAEYNKLQQLGDSYDYLRRELGHKPMIQAYGQRVLARPLDFSGKEIGYAYFKYPKGARVPVGDYHTFLPECRLKYEGEMLNAYHHDTLLLSINVKTYLGAYKVEMDEWNNEAKSVVPFCLTNDSCMVLLEQITRNNDGTYNITAYQNVMGFLK